MSICKVEENEPLCQMFARLHQRRIEEGETHRANAYVKAISSIQNYPYPITSKEQAKAILGVGERMATRIEEYLSTGRLVELDGPLVQEAEEGEIIELEVPQGAPATKWEEEEEKRRILSEFQEVHGVGPVTSLKWYNQGYRSLEEVPLEIMTSAQRIGVEFLEELKMRIPREEVALIDEEIRKTLEPYGIFHQICGSYLRGRPDCGDVDILIITQEGVDVLEVILTCPIFTHKLSRGPKKYMGVGIVDQIHRRIDVEVVQPHEYPFALMYFTGPKTFNTKLRDHFKEMGYTLNEKSLNDDEGTLYPANSEEDIFEMAGLQYLTPEERDKY